MPVSSDDVDVLVGVDLSDLETGLTQATSAAQTSAKAIEDAFNIPLGDELTKHLEDTANAANLAGQQFDLFGGTVSSALTEVSSQMKLFDTNSITAAENMQQMGDSASKAATGIDEIAPAAQHAGTAAEEAEGGLRGMAEQLVAIGEALIITEGLKEFGQEALTAYGTVQSVTIGLTQLTGSAEQAREAVDKIKELAATQPFAFPEIAPTIQKMVALGVSAEQLPAVMQAAADASAATGNAFSTVAASIDRLSLSGMAGQRQLVALGLNAEQLGKVMGVTAGEVAGAFKALDQSARIDVLTQALAKFAGAAEAQAQGISGQWQIFKNRFEEVMVGIGEALAPVVGDFLAFGKTVLGVLQGAAQAFNALPGPVKDFAVVIGIAAAAIVPLTAALGAIGLGVAGLTAALPALEALLVSVGLAAGETAVAEQAAAAATIEFETAAGGAAIAEGALATEATVAATGIGSIATAALGWTAAFGGPVLAAILATKQQIKDLGQSYIDLNATLHAHSIIEAINEGATLAALQNIGHSTKDLQDALGGVGLSGRNSFQEIVDSGGPVIGTFTLMGGTLDQLATALKGIESDGITAFDAIRHGATIPQLEFIFGDLTKIMEALNGIKLAAKAPFSAMAEGISFTIAGLGGLSTVVQAAIGRTNELNQAVANSKKVYDDAATAMRNHTAAANGDVVTQQTLTRLWQDYQKALVAANGAEKDTGNSLTVLDQQMADVTVKARLQVDALNDAITNYYRLKDGADESVEGQQALIDITKILEGAAKNLGIELDTTGDKLKFSLALPARDAQTPVAGLVDRLNGLGPAAEQAGVIINGKFVPALADATLAVGKLVNGVVMLGPAVTAAATEATAGVRTFHDAAASTGAVLVDLTKSVVDGGIGFISMGVAAKGASSYMDHDLAGASATASAAVKDSTEVIHSYTTETSKAGIVTGSATIGIQGMGRASEVASPGLTTVANSLVTVGQQAHNADGTLEGMSVQIQGLSTETPGLTGHFKDFAGSVVIASDEVTSMDDDLSAFDDAASQAESAAEGAASGFSSMAKAGYDAASAVNSLAAASSAAGMTAGGSNADFSLAGAKTSGTELGAWFRSVMNDPMLATDISNMNISIMGGNDISQGYSAMVGNYQSPEFQAILAAAIQAQKDWIASMHAGTAATNAATTATANYGTAITNTTLPLQVTGTNAQAAADALGNLTTAAGMAAGGFGDQSAAAIAAADALNNEFGLHAATVADNQAIDAAILASSRGGTAGSGSGTGPDAATIQKAYDAYYAALKQATAGLQDLTGDPIAAQKQTDQLYAAEKAAADALNAIVPYANAFPQASEGMVGSMKSATVDAGTIQKAYEQYSLAMSTAESGLRVIGQYDFAGQQKQLDSFYAASKAAADALNSMVPGANAHAISAAGMIGSTKNLAGDIVPLTGPGQYGKGTNYGAYSSSTVGQGNPMASFTLNVNPGMVVGDNGMQKLAQMIQDKVITQLKQAGLKL